MTDEEKFKEQMGDALTELAMAFAGLHEVYIGLRAAGFTTDEATKIVGVYMAESGKGGRDVA